MKVSALLLAATFFLPATGAFAQSFAGAPAAAQGGAPVAAPAPAAGRGSITYFGTVCSHDAGHAQFAQLRQAFAAAQPTLVLFENPDCGTDSTETATVARQGVGGYARFLAQQHRVAVARLDDPLAEYAYLQTKVDAERLKLYCLLRHAQQFRANTGASKGLMVKAMNEYIAKSAAITPGAEQVIRSLPEFEAAYRKYCPAGGKWWQAPAAWFGPDAAAASQGNAFLQEMAAAVGEFRAQNLERQLAAPARAGQRVLVVLDRAHLPAAARPAYAAQPPMSR